MTNRIHRIVPILLVSAALCLSAAGIAFAQGPDSGRDSPPVPDMAPELRLKIDPGLLKQLLESNQDQQAPVIVQLATEFDLEKLAAQSASDPDRQAEMLISGLRKTAEQSQIGAQAVLAQQEALGNANHIRSFWIFNGMAVDANLEAVLALASLPEVNLVRQDREYHLSEQPQPLEQNPTDRAQSAGENITQIQADLVWNALDVNGSGVLVANIDSGVDWIHPDLMTRYRGYDPHGLHRHSCNWADTTGQGAVYPIDDNGHGTHTMGTIVGLNGIGVAPGAQWIAVRSFDANGTAYESWLHAALEWVLDPGPDCERPAIVNNSWSMDGTIDVFRDDVKALRAAGIFVPFSAGNDGPNPGSIDAPASYPESFGVGAVDSSDVVASFSSRGPSRWFGDSLTKPELSAPGVHVRSTLPGGTYGQLSGTSMAAPHAAGVAALLLDADSSLNLDQIETILEQTAVPLGSTIPNDKYGWGRVDAYAAVASILDVGAVRGTITSAENGIPIAGAVVTAASTGSGPTVTVATDKAGAFTLALLPGRYLLTAAAFGHYDGSQEVKVKTASIRIRNIALQPLPAGTLTGRVTIEGKPPSPYTHAIYLPLLARSQTLNQVSVAAVETQAAGITISVEDTPITVAPDLEGYYRIPLPTGSYTLTVKHPDYRTLIESDISVTAGQTTTRNFDLTEKAPSILLVNSGAWYYGSQTKYYRYALDQLRYPYQVWNINDATRDVPGYQDLKPYQIVIWSSPTDSPGYIYADEALGDYLDQGGALFLSGQDVAYYDGYFPLIFAPYFKKQLKARYVKDDAGIFQLEGSPPGLFDGLQVTIQGTGGADNQTSPDEITTTDPDLAVQSFAYLNSGSGGQQLGVCLPYRVIFLSFGFEGITNADTRTQIMERSIQYFTGSPPTGGLELAFYPADQWPVGDFGETVSHTLRLRNTAWKPSSQETDVFKLTWDGSTWPVQVDKATHTLGSCEDEGTATVRIDVDVPDGADWGNTDLLTVTARGKNHPELTANITVETRAPSPLLLVDDDRYNNVEDSYVNGLNAHSIPFDLWTVPWSFSGEPPSPPLSTLQAYPMVMWFTGSDWYQPLTEKEETRLAHYLEGGGRLYFSGQEYLYQRQGQYDFAQKYLGVLTHTEILTSTEAAGVITNPIGSGLGPEILVYRYTNWTDALTPTTQADVAFVGQAQQPNALTNQNSNWRTTFFAFGPDGLSSNTNAHLMQRITGWLSWLGSSKTRVDRSLALSGETLTYTVVLRNDGYQDMDRAHLTGTFTADLIPIPSSVTGGASWDPAQSAITWEGAIPQQRSHTISYQAQITHPLPAGHVVSHTVWLAYDQHRIAFDRSLYTTVNAPNLGQSTFTVSPSAAEPGGILTYTLQARNTGVVDRQIVVTNRPPSGLEMLTSSLKVSDGTIDLEDGALRWTVGLSIDADATLSYTARVGTTTPGAILRNQVRIKDGLGDPLVLSCVATVGGKPTYLPLLWRNGSP